MQPTSSCGACVEVQGVAYVSDIADWLVEAGVDVMEGEKIDWHAIFGRAQHHITSIWPLGGRKHAAVVVDVVSDPWAANHCVWISILHQGKLKAGSGGFFLPF